MKAGPRIKGIPDNANNAVELVKDSGIGALAGFLAAAIFVAVYAILMNWFHFSENSIPVVNVVAKAVCMLVAALAAIWRRPQRGWLKGAMAGALYVILAFILFSILDQNWTIGWPFLADLVMGIIVGAIGGIFFVNLRKPK